MGLGQPWVIGQFLNVPRPTARPVALGARGDNLVVEVVAIRGSVAGRSCRELAFNFGSATQKGYRLLPLAETKRLMAVWPER